ncbi:MAG TPA: hypothetical protein VIG24_03560 [Acidimicrobiia bacterium]
MGSAKDILLRPIEASEANALVKRLHYSGKVTQNSQIHIGVFMGGRLLGAMQFGPSIDKRRMQGLVADTPWNGFIELNRMAFDERLPRNSESRALGIAMRLLRKNAPHIQWVVSFADGAQCGDGTIYRAAGFALTGLRRNTSMIRLEDGSVVARKSLDNLMSSDGRYLSSVARERGIKPMDGYQLKYVYFLHPTARERLTVPILPFSAIDDAGARMYRGTRAGSVDSDAATFRVDEGGASPTPALSGDHDG